MTDNNTANKFKGKSKKFVKNMVESASPTQLVALLYDGAAQWIYMAKQELVKNKEIELPNWSNYCHYIGMAAKIMTHLQETLDHSYAPEVADNLFELYDFIKTKLFDANAKKEEKFIEEASAILKEIRDSWKEGMKLMKASA